MSDKKGSYSSGPIRTQLGAAYSRLDDALKKFIVEFNAGKFSPAQKVDEGTEVYLERLNFEESQFLILYEKIERNLNTMIILVQDWTLMISNDSIGREALEYERFIAEVKDFPSLMGNSQEKLAELKGLKNTYTYKIKNTSNELKRLHRVAESVVSSTASSRRSSRAGSPNRTRLRMKKVDIPTFNGKLREWPQFISMFAAIVDNTTMSGTEKFIILKSLLADEPLKMIKDITISDANYRAAFDSLKARYGDQTRLVHELFHDLQTLKATGEVNKVLRTTYNEINSIILQLKNENENVDNEYIRYNIGQKFPEIIHTEIEKSKEECKNAGEVWSTTKLLNTIEKKIVLMEKVHHNVQSSKPKYFSNRSHEKSHRTRPYWDPRESQPTKNFSSAFATNTKTTSDSEEITDLAQAFAVKTDLHPKWDPEKNRPCFFCQGAHFPSSCLKVLEEEDRKKTMEEMDPPRCTKCTSSRHKTEACDIRLGPCKHCKKGRHHIVFCKRHIQDLKRRFYKEPFQNKPSQEKKPQFQKKNAFPKHKNPNRGFKASATFNVVEGQSKSEDGYDTDAFNECSESETEYETESESEEYSNKARAEVEITDRDKPIKITLLSCIRVFFQNPDFPELSTWTLAFMDSGSVGKSNSYILEDLADKLALQGPCQKLKLNTLNNSTQEKHVRSVRLNIRTVNGSFFPVELKTLESLTVKPVPAFILDKTRMPDLDLQDETLEPIEVIPQILLGQKYFCQLVEFANIKHLPSGFLYMPTKIGPMLAGEGLARLSSNQTDVISSCSFHACSYENNEVYASLGHSYAAEFEEDINSTFKVTSPEFEPETAAELLCNPETLEKAVESLSLLETIGVSDSPHQDDDEIAYEKIRKSIRRLSNGRYEAGWPWKYSPKLIQKFSDNINEQLKLDVIEKVPDSVHDGPPHYIPFHAVYKMSNSGELKMRIVNDASAKTGSQGKSMNQYIFRGPVMLPESYPAIGPTPENIETYRPCVIWFGVIASPAILGVVIDHHLVTYYPELAERILRETYVDNDAQMHLRDYLSNSPNLMNSLKEDIKTKDKVVKVLGVLWDSTSDCFILKIKPPTQGKPITKRVILMDIYKQFDPPGLTAPLFVSAKLLMQEIWIKKLSWDEIVPARVGQKWSEITKGWNGSEIRVPRFIGDSSPPKSFQLHCYSDASQHAYACACMLRILHENGKISRQLMFSKSRIRPIPKLVKKKNKVTSELHQNTSEEDEKEVMKGLSIPTLELMGLLCVTRAANYLKNELNINIESTYVWTDSRVVLAWVVRRRTLKRFVENRVKEIRAHQRKNNITFLYVETSKNPADIGSRGASYDELANSYLWWHGPEELEQHPETWLKNQPDLQKLPEDDEEVYGMAVKMDEIQEALVFFDVKKTKFFNLTWMKLCKTMVFVLRFLKLKIIVKLPENRKIVDKFRSIRSGSVTAEELELAEHLLVRQTQKETSVNNKELKHLNLQEDENGILRSIGRLANSSLNPNAKFPIFLPRKHQYTQLIILHYHLKNLHGGNAQALADIREKFWIPRGRWAVRHAIRRLCFQCRKFNAKPFRLPAMPALPSRRVTEDRIWKDVGLDFFGPVQVRTLSNEVKKIWVALFTCFRIRAIYVDIVLDNSAEMFLNCLRRFISQYGAPATITSDNAQEAESMVNSRPLTYVSEDVNDFEVLQPSDFIVPCMQQGTPVINLENNEYKPFPGSREKLLALWQKSSEYLKKFWDTFHHLYLKNLREHHILLHKQPYLTTSREPHLNEIVIVEEDNIPRGTWKIARIVELHRNSDNAVYAAKIFTSDRRNLKRSIGQLIPLEVTDEFYTSNSKTSKEQPKEQQLTEEEAKDEEKITDPEKDKTTNKKMHHYNLRNRLRMHVSSVFLFIFLIFSVFKSTLNAEIMPISGKCTRKGIELNLAPNIRQVRTCVKPYCFENSYLSALEHVLFPKHLLLYFQNVEITYWIGGSEQENQFFMSCPPLKTCEIIECRLSNLCLDYLANPHCLPWISLFLVALLTYMFVSTVYITIRTIIDICDAVDRTRRSVTKILGFIWNVLYWSYQNIFYQIYRKISNLFYKEPKEKADGQNDLFRVCVDVQERPQLQHRRVSQVLREAARLCIIALTLASIGPRKTLARDCAEIVTATLDTIVCKLEFGKLICPFNKATRFSIPPYGQTLCFQVHNINGEPISTIEFTVKNIEFICSPVSHHFTREFELKHHDEKLCAMEGNCRGTFCAELRPQQYVKEMDAFANRPGHNICAESCGWFTCKCPLPTAGCLVGRVYADETNDKTVHEIVSCPFWTLSLLIHGQVITNNNTKDISMSLKPGVTWKSKDLDLQATLISQITPPTSLWNSFFINNGTHYALIRDDAFENSKLLHCDDLESALKFDCKFPLDVCQYTAAETSFNVNCKPCIFTKAYEDSLLPLVFLFDYFYFSRFKAISAIVSPYNLPFLGKNSIKMFPRRPFYNRESAYRRNENRFITRRTPSPTRRSEVYLANPPRGINRPRNYHHQKCPYLCSNFKGHRPEECQEFITPSERVSCLIAQGKCTLCVTRHTSSNCPDPRQSRRSCEFCRKAKLNPIRSAACNDHHKAHCVPHFYRRDIHNSALRKWYEDHGGLSYYIERVIKSTESLASNEALGLEPPPSIPELEDRAISPLRMDEALDYNEEPCYDQEPAPQGAPSPTHEIDMNNLELQDEINENEETEPKNESFLKQLRNHFNENVIGKMKNMHEWLSSHGIEESQHSVYIETLIELKDQIFNYFREEDLPYPGDLMMLLGM
uniref:Integrase catalytic domain-containing protein n=1 Tax=Acrobeloides nanus TaxID=290746 RepID=A0A914DTY8_9BILA